MRRLRDLCLLAMTLGVLAIAAMGGSGVLQSGAYFSDEEQFRWVTRSRRRHARADAGSVTTSTSPDTPADATVSWTVPAGGFLDESK